MQQLWFMQKVRLLPVSAVEANNHLTWAARSNLGYDRLADFSDGRTLRALGARSSGDSCQPPRSTARGL